MENTFLINLYAATALVRLLVGGAIYFGGYTGFFAGDAGTYDSIGWAIARSWAGDLQNPRLFYSNISNLGLHGMYYWVAGIYSIFGHSLLIATVIQILIISATPLFVYSITRRIYRSVKAARLASLLTAFLPSMVIWSCTLLKDPLIVLLLCITIFFTLKTQQQLRLRYLIPGAAAMLVIYPIRGYIFYFILTSVVGTLLLSRFGRSASMAAYFVRLGGIALIAIVLFIFDFDRIASQQMNLNLLEMMQVSRADLAHSAASGYEEKANINTLETALAFLPKGIVYLLFAPFPWQSGSVRQMLTIPDTLLWYGLFPFCIWGIIYTARRHFRDTIIIFLFVVQLTCFYGVFIGNVGTAHRQRTQILIFYLIFTAVGLVHSRRKNRQPDGSIRDIATN